MERMSISDLAIARDERVAELTEGLAKALDIIVWMSGSPSFSPDGEARIGWEKAEPTIAALLKLTLRTPATER